MEENFSEVTLTRIYHNLKKLKISKENTYLIKISKQDKLLTGGFYISIKIK